MAARRDIHTNKHTVIHPALMVTFGEAALGGFHQFWFGSTLPLSLRSMQSGNLASMPPFGSVAVAKRIFG